jgi:hypothetical protein
LLIDKIMNNETMHVAKREDGKVEYPPVDSKTEEIGKSSLDSAAEFEEYQHNIPNHPSCRIQGHYG